MSRLSSQTDLPSQLSTFAVASLALTSYHSVVQVTFIDFVIWSLSKISKSPAIMLLLLLLSLSYSSHALGTVEMSHSTIGLPLTLSFWGLSLSVYGCLKSRINSVFSCLVLHICLHLETRSVLMHLNTVLCKTGWISFRTWAWLLFVKAWMKHNL